MSRAKIQMTPAGLRPCGACVHEGYEPGRKHCHLCQVMGLYTPKPEEAGDVMAVLYRALNEDGQKKEEKND